MINWHGPDCTWGVRILYVIANDGYAVVDENNVVKIFTNSKQKFILDNVKYLNSLESFEDAEQKILKKLK